MMVISNKTLQKIVLGSFVGMFGSCSGSIYLLKPTPEDEQMAEIQKNKYSTNERFLQCAPRERGTSISDACRDYLLRYDSLSKEEAVLEKTSEYVSSQKRKSYSSYLLFGNLLCLGVYIGASGALGRRRKEEGEGRGE